MKIKVKDIADKLGISSSTVSLVLNNRPSRISEKTRLKILALAGKMNYDKLNNIELEEKLQSNTIAIFVNSFDNKRNTDIILKICNILKKEKIEVFIIPISNEYDLTLNSIDNILVKGINAIVFIELNEDSDIADYLSVFSLPIILINSDIQMDNASIIEFSDEIKTDMVINKISLEIIDRVVNNKKPKYIVLG